MLNSSNRIMKQVVILLMASWMISCTKDAENASKISRNLIIEPDSTVYASFYDEYIVDKADITPDVNDKITTEGIQSIVKSNCSSAPCHGVAIKPILNTYQEIKNLVSPGNPQGSKLFELITTEDENRAMPPVNYGIDLTLTEKNKIYNWIKNGANEKPGLVDFRPAAITLIVNGCTSGNCHNAATVGGEWARKGLISFKASDTTTFVYINPGTGSVTNYTQLKEPVLSKVWQEYKDSVRKFYQDTLANASFRPYKTFSTPTTTASRRGPLNSYDDIILDIWYPKSIRSNSAVVYTESASGKKFYVRGDNLNSTSSMLSRVDSTLLLANPRTGVFASRHQGEMAYDDGGLTPSEIALIKAWYFADPNIPDVWKYGTAVGTGIFKYKKSGKVILK